eukprot:1199430-Amphidinium_carterae.1
MNLPAMYRETRSQGLLYTTYTLENTECIKPGAHSPMPSNECSKPQKGPNAAVPVVNFQQNARPNHIEPLI